MRPSPHTTRVGRKIHVMGKYLKKKNDSNLAFLQVGQNWREQRALLLLHSASILTKPPTLCNVQNKFGWSHKQFIKSKPKIYIEKKTIRTGTLNLYLNMHIYILCPYWVIWWKYIKGLWEELQCKGKDLALLYMYEIERDVSMEISNVIHIKVLNSYAVQ